jgi:hypothetical protein
MGALQMTRKLIGVFVLFVRRFTVIMPTSDNEKLTIKAVMT